MIILRPSRLRWGAYRDRHGRKAAGCGGREGAQRAMSAPTKASSRTAKSCGPDPPTLGPSLRWWSAGDGGYQARHSRESTKQPLKPSRRECRLFRPCLWWLPPAFHLAGGPWVRPASGIPCALFCSRATHKAALGHECAAGMRRYGLPSAVIPAKAGNPVFQRRLGSSTAASGILDRPVVAGRWHRGFVWRFVGWVERSETHLPLGDEDGGFRFALPTLRSRPAAPAPNVNLTSC